MEISRKAPTVNNGIEIKEKGVKMRKYKLDKIETIQRLHT